MLEYPTNEEVVMKQAKAILVLARQVSCCPAFLTPSVRSGAAKAKGGVPSPAPYKRV